MSARQRKAHVKEDEWQTGGFHVDRHVRCRCGWEYKHYNRGKVNEEFKKHQEAASVAPR